MPAAVRSTLQAARSGSDATVVCSIRWVFAVCCGLCAYLFDMTSTTAASRSRAIALVQPFTVIRGLACALCINEDTRSIAANARPAHRLPSYSCRGS